VTDFLTIAEAAERLRCCEPVLRRAIANGIVPSVRVGARTIRIPAGALERLPRTSRTRRRRRR